MSLHVCYMAELGLSAAQIQAWVHVAGSVAAPESRAVPAVRRASTSGRGSAPCATRMCRRMCARPACSRWATMRCRSPGRTASTRCGPQSVLPAHTEYNVFSSSRMSLRVVRKRGHVWLVCSCACFILRLGEAWWHKLHRLVEQLAINVFCQAYDAHCARKHPGNCSSRTLFEFRSSQCTSCADLKSYWVL